MFSSFLTLGVLLAGGMVYAGESPKAGLQVGDRLPGAFSPLNVTGAHAGRKHCLVCEHGLNPAVVVFARDLDAGLLLLIAQLEAAAGKHRGVQLGAFVVFLNAGDGLEKRLQEAAKKLKLQEVVLAIDDPAGPEGYAIDREVAVLVVLYCKHEVKARHAFKKDELTEKNAAKILDDLPKILPAK
jgi:hypothetical protein